MAEQTRSAIGFLLKGYPRLSETFINNEIRLLEDQGYEIHIVAMRNPGESRQHESVERIRARVDYIPDYFWPNFTRFLRANAGLFLKNPGRYWPEFVFALRRSLRRKDSATLKRFAQAAIFVQDVLPDSNIGYLHAHFSHDPTTVAYFASRLTGMDYSFSAHAKDIYVQERSFLQRKLAHARFAVTCTGFNHEFLENVADRPGDVHRCYHGIDLDLFIRRSGADETKRVPHLLSVGRFVPKKGFPTLLKALAILKEEGVAWTCELVGGGPLESELQELAREYGIDDRLTIGGQVTQRELIPLLELADVFVLACEVQPDGDRDGIPNVLVEAMAMQVPVVTTEISGIPELVKSGKNGMLVPEKNPEAFAAALRDLLEDRDRAAEMAAAGRRTVEQLFDNRVNVRQIGALIDRARGTRTAPISNDVRAAESAVE